MKSTKSTVRDMLTPPSTRDSWCRSMTKEEICCPRLARDIRRTFRIKCSLNLTQGPSNRHKLLLMFKIIIRVLLKRTSCMEKRTHLFSQTMRVSTTEWQD